MTKKVTGFRDSVRKRIGSDAPNPGFLSDMLNTTSLKNALIRLNLDQIRRYERNPRRFGNAEYEDIRESIRQRGLDQPLVVTQRPGETFYVLKKGAGTRLQALQELWAETGDQRFYQQECVFEPYRDELDLFVGHGIENLKRSQMSFIETAFFYMDLKQFHEDLEGRELSTREACERINADGFSVDPSRLVRYRYGVDLYQQIPMALEGGISQRTTEQIRRLERSYRTLWERHSAEAPRFDALWCEALASGDHPDVFDLAELQTRFEQAMASALGLNPRHLTAEADVLLQQLDPAGAAELQSPAPEPGEPGEFATDDKPQPEPEMAANNLTAPVRPSQSATSTSPRPEPTVPAVPNATGGRPEPPTPAAAPVSIPTEPTASAVTNTSTRHPAFNLSRALTMPDNPPVPYSIEDRHRHLLSQPHPDDPDPFFRAARSSACWAHAIFSCFPIARFINQQGNPNDPITLVDDSNQPAPRYRLELNLMNRHLDGSLLVDYVWWRLWKTIEGPYFDEEPAALERNLLCRQAVFIDEQHQLAIDLRSPLLFSDPACQWIDTPLRLLEQTQREFHRQRRQSPDPYINPLGIPG